MKSSNTKTTQSKDKLLGPDWSVPVFSSISELKVGEPGVCMASVSETKKAIAELKGEKALAVVCPANIDSKGEELHVLIEDPSGRWQTRRRFLFQLGSGHVTYMDDKSKNSFTHYIVKVVLRYAKQHTGQKRGAVLSNATKKVK